MNNFDDCDRCGSERHNTNVGLSPAGYNTMRLFVPDLRFRNAPLSGDYMSMLPIVNARLFSSTRNRNNHSLSARVERATSQTTSGATIAETMGTLVTYVRQISHGSIAYENNLTFADPHRIAKSFLAHTIRQTRRLPLACGTCSRGLSSMPLRCPCALAHRATGKTGKPLATAGAQTRP